MLVLCSTIVLSVVVLAISASVSDLRLFYFYVLIFLAIFIVNILAKKIVAFYFEIETEIRLWEFSQYWFRKVDRFKKPLPMVWLPIVLALLSKGHILWMALTEFRSRPGVGRVLKRHVQKFYYPTEWHLALIVFFGILANNLFGVLAYFLSLNLLAKYSIYFAFWNLLPLSSLDGSKIFYGSRRLWIFSFVISIGFLLFALGI